MGFDVHDYHTPARTLLRQRREKSRRRQSSLAGSNLACTNSQVTSFRDKVPFRSRAPFRGRAPWLLKASALVCTLAALFAFAPLPVVQSEGIARRDRAQSEQLAQLRHTGTLHASPNRASSKTDPTSRTPLAKKPSVSQRYLQAGLSKVALKKDTSDRITLAGMPRFSTRFAGRYAGVTPLGELVYYTLDPELQEYTSKIVREASAPHIAVVAMEPYTGRVLAIAEKSPQIKNLALHAEFPAASLFKIITAAAALEQTDMTPSSVVRFRGGTYTLNKWNYQPDPKRDRRSMKFDEALARSCNPVFARIALTKLTPSFLRDYAAFFGFNQPLDFDITLPVSKAAIPGGDFEVSRTAAGFGAVTTSPVHAAAFMSGIANGGLLPRPILVSSVIAPTGNLVFHNRPRISRRIVQPQTSQVLMDMMEQTTTIGTSRREFMYRSRPRFPSLRVAAKTGTLSGENPKGVNNWFIAAAPIEDPQIALAVIVVNPGGISSKASRIGRKIIERFLVT